MNNNAKDCGGCNWSELSNDLEALDGQAAGMEVQCPTCGRWLNDPGYGDTTDLSDFCGCEIGGHEDEGQEDRYQVQEDLDS